MLPELLLPRLESHAGRRPASGPTQAALETCTRHVSLKRPCGAQRRRSRPGRLPLAGSNRRRPREGSACPALPLPSAAAPRSLHGARSMCCRPRSRPRAEGLSLGEGYFAASARGQGARARPPRTRRGGTCIQGAAAKSRCCCTVHPPRPSPPSLPNGGAPLRMTPWSPGQRLCLRQPALAAWPRGAGRMPWARGAPSARWIPGARAQLAPCRQPRSRDPGRCQTERNPRCQQRAERTRPGPRTRRRNTRAVT
mmetsp:Transcript_106198/g.342591  ORF Transcript_106198/g.342591 Transcript_106198/m.342591 type:complete len:253 (+) Transcript_106198:651-1409(+)